MTTKLQYLVTQKMDVDLSNDFRNPNTSSRGCLAPLYNFLINEMQSMFQMQGDKQNRYW